MQQYAPAKGCDLRLNAWCDANCPHSARHGSLVARFDRAKTDPGKAWRCYANATLDPTGVAYLQGDTYCTRHFQLAEELTRCLSVETTAATVDAMGQARPMQRPTAHSRPTPGPPRPTPGPPSDAIRWPQARKAPSEASPRYVHTEAFMVLPSLLKLPVVEDCKPEVREGMRFWAVSLYTTSYAHKAQRLVDSCEAWGVCCTPALMPDGALQAVDGENTEGSYAVRHRLIASKPLFMLSMLRRSPVPIAWLDVDLEFHSFPTLFTPDGWREHPEPRDVLLWNWQANVSAFHGRRLKMASGVAWFNKTRSAEDLLIAWAESMAYEGNVRAPDDQALDLLVNEDGWIDRANFGWLPESYLRMMPRHKDIHPVIDHDRGGPISPPGKNSPIKPVLPPRLAG